jgi:hypothetical protein
MTVNSSCAAENVAVTVGVNRTSSSSNPGRHRVLRSRSLERTFVLDRIGFLVCTCFMIELPLPLQLCDCTEMRMIIVLQSMIGRILRFSMRHGSSKHVRSNSGFFGSVGRFWRVPRICLGLQGRLTVAAEISTRVDAYYGVRLMNLRGRYSFSRMWRGCT